MKKLLIVLLINSAAHAQQLQSTQCRYKDEYVTSVFVIAPKVTVHHITFMSTTNKPLVTDSPKLIDLLKRNGVCSVKTKDSVTYVMVDNTKLYPIVDKAYNIKMHE